MLILRLNQNYSDKHSKYWLFRQCCGVCVVDGAAPTMLQIHVDYMRSCPGVLHALWPTETNRLPGLFFSLGHRFFAGLNIFIPVVFPLLCSFLHTHSDSFSNVPAEATVKALLDVFCENLMWPFLFLSANTVFAFIKVCLDCRLDNDQECS